MVKKGATRARVIYLVTALLIHLNTIKQAVAPTTQTMAALNGLDRAVYVRDVSMGTTGVLVCAIAAPPEARRRPTAAIFRNRVFIILPFVFCCFSASRTTQPGNLMVATTPTAGTVLIPGKCLPRLDSPLRPFENKETGDSTHKENHGCIERTR